jgi:hypothetical protein
MPALAAEQARRELGFMTWTNESIIERQHCRFP